MMVQKVMNYSGGTFTKLLEDSINTTDNLMTTDGDYQGLDGVERDPYCGQDVIDFHEGFKVYHVYFSIIVCAFGIVTNVLNIIVLTRKDMLTPTNAILTGLAVADMLVMLEYLPYTIHSYVLKDQPREVRLAYHWAVFVLFHAHFTVVCHTISIALTVCLAVWRYIAVSVPQRNRDWCNMRRAQIAIVSSYIFSILFCIPAYLVFSVRSTPNRDDTINEVVSVLYIVDVSEIGRAHDGLLQNLNFWMYSVMVKLIPCVALTILSLSLINALYQANQRKIKLVNRASESDRSCDRTTRMLLAVLLLFLITEFPQGILALLSGILGERFFMDCYQSFGEVMDLLALINSAINFILYCTMSRQFRQTFNKLFRPRILNKWIAIPQDPNTQATTCV